MQRNERLTGSQHKITKEKKNKNDSNAPRTPETRAAQRSYSDIYRSSRNMTAAQSRQTSIQAAAMTERAAIPIPTRMEGRIQMRNQR